MHQQAKKGFRRWILIAACAALTPPWAAAKQGPEKGKGGSKKQDPASEQSSVEVHVFLGQERELIRAYCAERKGNLPPGLAKRGGNLPPGLEKQLRKNGRLPPGLEKRMAPFPDELAQRLSEVDPSLRRGFFEGRAILYHPKTRVIFDLFVAF